jgi:hypothetical protein
VLPDDFVLPFPALVKNPVQLSSDQIFLGLMKSFQPGHLITDHGKMGQALKGELDLIERRFFTLHGHKLDVCEFRMQVHIAAARMEIEAPQKGRREAYLKWLGMHWESG